MGHKSEIKNFFRRIALFVVIATCSFIITQSAWAQPCTPTPNKPCPAQIQYGGPPQQTVTGGIGSYIARLYQIGFGVVGVAAFFSIVFGGLQYTISAGSPSKIEDAKDRIRGAIYGILLLLMSWIILNTINPRIIALGQPGGFDPTNKSIYPCPPGTSQFTVPNTTPPQTICR